MIGLGMVASRCQVCPLQHQQSFQTLDRRELGLITAMKQDHLTGPAGMKSLALISRGNPAVPDADRLAAYSGHVMPALAMQHATL